MRLLPQLETTAIHLSAIAFPGHGSFTLTQRRRRFPRGSGNMHATPRDSFAPFQRAPWPAARAVCLSRGGENTLLVPGCWTDVRVRRPDRPRRNAAHCTGSVVGGEPIIGFAPPTYLSDVYATAMPARAWFDREDPRKCMRVRHRPASRRATTATDAKKKGEPASKTTPANIDDGRQPDGDRSAAQRSSFLL